eukprot:6173173-Pleurochrysis_carterae.AAC.1
MSMDGSLGAELLAEPDVPVVVQVGKHAMSCAKQRRRWATHCAAEHADRVCDVRACLRGAVQQCTNQGLVRAEQVVCSGCVRTVHGGGYAVGQECADHVLYVTGLSERYMVIMSAYLHVEKV